jgi:hypothetical protein
MVLAMAWREQKARHSTLLIFLVQKNPLKSDNV